MIVMWFIMGLVSLPSIDLYFKMGISSIFQLLKLEIRDVQWLPKQFLFNQIHASCQWNLPVPPNERTHSDGRQDFLYLIRPLLTIMQKNFRLAWIPSVDLTVDESLWSFKGRTYLKRFMKDKPKNMDFWSIPCAHYQDTSIS